MKNLIFLLLVLITSCKQVDTPVHSFIAKYDIQSIRVDDDGEYHIVAVSAQGNVKTLHDVDNGLTVYLKYGNYEKPYLTVPISDKCCGSGNYSAEDYETVFLPFNYKIETFND